jgi:adenylate kinase family enzyme
MITVGGRRGSGRSTLAKSIAEQLQTDYETKYLSFGDTVRKIGRQTIDSFYSQTIQDHLNGSSPSAPLDDEIVYGVMTEALSRADDAELLIIDGHPKNEVQAQHLLNLADEDERQLAGLIITTTDEATALERLLIRGRRGLNTYLDEDDALNRIHQHDQAFGGAVLYLYNKGLRFERVDTTGSKNASAKKGLSIARSFLKYTNGTNNLT